MDGNNMPTTESPSYPKNVTGPATTSPRIYPRPTPPHFSKPLMNFVMTSVRGPMLGAILFHTITARILRRTIHFLVHRMRLSEQTSFGLLLPFVHSTTYTLSFLMFETIERFELLEEYRIGRTPAQQPTWKMKSRAFLETAQGWPGMFIGGQILYRVLQWRGSNALSSPLPTLLQSAYHLSVNVLFDKVAFYCIHRLLHSPMLYQRIHKKHHEFVSVSSVAAQSLHPVESLLQTIPIFIGSIPLKTHPQLWLHFLAWRIYTGMEGHSGYCFRGSFLHDLGLTNADDSLYHYCHHANYGNFGAYYLDWLFGTQDFWVHVGEDEGYLALCKRRELEAKQGGE